MEGFESARPRDRLLALGRLVAEIIVFLLGYELLWRLLASAQGWWARSLFRSGRALLVEEPRWIVPFIVSTFVLLPLLRWGSGGWSWREFGLQRAGAGEGMRQGAVFLSGALLWINLGLLAVPGIGDRAWAAYGIENRGDLLVFVLFLSPVVAALGEEFLFRSVLQGGMEAVHRSWGPLAVALVFAGAHYFQGWVALAVFHLPLSLLIMVIYRGQRSVYGLVAAHAAFDMVIFSELYLFYAVFPDGGARTLLCLTVLALSGTALVWLRPSMRAIAAEARRWAGGLGRDLWVIPAIFVAGAVVLAALPVLTRADPGTAPRLGRGTLGVAFASTLAVLIALRWVLPPSKRQG